MRKGFSIVEVLGATLIMGVCISGMISAWSYTFNKAGNSRDLATASEVARAEIERAKVFGYEFMPKGSYDSSNNVGTWEGSFNTAANSGTGAWAANQGKFYSHDGQILNSAAGAKFQLSLKLTDTEVMASSQGGYELGSTAKRTLVATVKKLPEDQPFVVMATILAKGGL